MIQRKEKLSQLKIATLHKPLLSRKKKKRIIRWGKPFGFQILQLHHAQTFDKENIEYGRFVVFTTNLTTENLSSHATLAILYCCLFLGVCAYRICFESIMFYFVFNFYGWNLVHYFIHRIIL